MLNLIFTVLFTVEMILKLMAFKIKVKNNPLVVSLMISVNNVSSPLPAGLLWRPLERL